MKQTRIEDIVLIYLMEANLGRIFYIGLATGHLSDCIILDVALQLLALGWANIGAAVAPDAALASLPAWFTGGMTVDGGMVVAVGYAMVINLVDDSTLQKILSALAGGTSLTPEKVTTLQDNLNQLIPVFAALLLTFACMWLLKRKVSLSPISIIFVFFELGVLDHVTGII